MKNPTPAPRPSPALIVAIIALVAALAGSAVALPGKNTIDKNDIKKGAVTKKAIKKNAVTTKAIKDAGVTGVDIADGSITSAKIADGEVGAADLTDAEAPRLVGAPGQPAFSNGGEGDCFWQDGSALAAGLGPVTFYKDPGGFVHLNGVALSGDGSGGDGVCDSSDPGESEDGIIYTLPPGYQPDNTELQGPDSLNLVIITGEEGLTSGTTVIPGGTVYFTTGAASGGAVMDGALFRPAGPALNKSDGSKPGDLDAILDLLR